MSSPSYDSGRELDAQEIVTLKDVTGRSLDCYIENEVVSDGNTYFLLQPVDPPIVVLAWDDEEEETDIPETDAENAHFRRPQSVLNAYAP